MARENRRVIRNLLDLPWKEDRAEAMRIYMQIYRAPDPVKKMQELLLEKSNRRGGLILVVPIMLMMPLYSIFGLMQFLLLM